MAKTSKLLLFGGLGLAAYLLLTKSGTATAAAASPPPTDTAGFGVSTPPIAATPSTGYANTLEQTTGAPSGNGRPGNIDANVYDTVVAWLQADADPALARMQLDPIPSEFNNLYTIITQNTWGNLGPLELFWNNLYNKYHSY